ncbi:MAG: DUF4956 domain-containing protein [Oscillospiraceae bacterium]|nr:DUF4956 domain-containing protein [Oscillospiraceae bacterium]
MYSQIREMWDLFLSPNQVESLNASQVLLTLTVATVCGLAIFMVYRYFYKGVVYSVNFNVLILMVCVVTALIIVTIGANLVLTLGMVGALSIVRFRAAVKDPLDVGFLFWAVSAGLTAGARLYPVALLGTAFIAAVYIVLTAARIERRCYLLIIRHTPEADDAVAALLEPLKARVKNKTAAKDAYEITAEVRVRRGDTSFIEPLRQTGGVESVTLVEYTGDYA